MTDFIILILLLLVFVASGVLVVIRSDRAWEKHNAERLEEFKRLPQHEKDAWAKMMLEQLRKRR